MRILNICHASPEIGIGHVSRLRNLSRAIMRKKKEIDINFLISGALEEDFLDPFKSAKIDFYINDYHAILRHIDSLSPDLIMLDLSPKIYNYNFIDFLKSINKKKIKIISIDGLTEFHTLIDLIWIPAFTINDKILSEEIEVIRYGWDCFLIERSLPIKKWKHGKKVTFLTGGSDPTGISSILPKMLEKKIQNEIIIQWVRGPFSEIPQIPQFQNHKWTVFNKPTEVEQIIYESDYIFSVYGVSFFEALQHGKPTVVFPPYADNDKNELDKLKKEDVAMIASSLDDGIDKLNNLMSDNSLAEKFSKNSLSKLKDNGCDILAEKIISNFNE